MLSVLAGRPEWERVAGRMAATKSGVPVPPPSKWHEPEANLYPGLSSHPFHAKTDPWWTELVGDAVELLERFYPAIKAEMLALRSETLQQYRQPNTATQERELAADGKSALLHERGDWKVHYLQLEGADTSAQNRMAPKASRVVRSIKRAAGHALFSVLEPGTHILPHCGPSNYRLRLHLGLVVPEGCRIRVGDETRTWEEGRVLVLDDSFQHEVWNDSDSQRIVLIVDIWHPDFSEKEVLFIEQMREAKRKGGDGREGAQKVADVEP